MDHKTLLLAGAIVLATHFIGAITGYGSTLLALPLLLWLIGDLKTSVVALLILGTVQPYHIALYTYRDADWRRICRILLLMGIGLPVGIFSMRHLPRDALILVLGVVLLAGGLSRLLPGSQEGGRTPPLPVLDLLLLLGGVIHGAFACGGATLAVYAQYALVRKEVVRGTLCMIWVIVNTLMVAGAFVHGDVSASALRLVVVGLPFLLAGNWLGEHSARRISQLRFTQLLAALLVASGVIMILRVVS